MSMEINGSYHSRKIDYVSQPKEERPQERTQPEQEGIPAPKDEYISSEKAGVRPSGLYRLGQDGSGNPKIVYEDPKKEDLKEGNPKKAAPSGQQPEAEPAGVPEDPQEKCVASTDKVDREIRKLKEKKQQLEQQIQAASGDERKVQELERKLAQVEGELGRKDNDTYRRQHTTIAEIG